MPRPSRQRWQRRGRATLGWAVAMVVAAQLAVGLMLDGPWWHIRFPDAADTVDRAGEGPGPSVVCLGSSRLALAIRPRILGDCLRQATGDRSLRVFNGSIPLGNLLTTHVIHAALDERGHRPAVMVIEISPETLARHNAWRSTDMQRLMTWSTLGHILRQTPESRLRAWQLRLWPVYHHRRELLDHMAGMGRRPTSVTDDFDGIDWETLMRQLDPLDPAGAIERSRKGVARVQDWLADYEVGGWGVECLEETLRLCQRRQVPVVLVGAPASAPLKSLYTPDVRGKYLAYVQGLGERFGTRYVEFHEHTADHWFLDEYHLVREGGQWFSTTLGQEVLAPLLREAAGESRSASRRP